MERKDPSMIDIRNHLIDLEDMIIYALYSRIKYLHNSRIYRIPKSRAQESNGTGKLWSLLDDLEQTYADHGRYSVPEERPFFSINSDPEKQAPNNFISMDNFNIINLGSEIFSEYKGFARKMCQKGNDGEYGSAAKLDIDVLQLIAERIHYGSFYVAERKYKDKQEKFDKLIDDYDAEGLMKAITIKYKEREVISRVRKKATDEMNKYKKRKLPFIKPKLIVDFYKDVIMNLTKIGEVRYLLNRKREIKNLAA